MKNCEEESLDFCIVHGNKKTGSKSEKNDDRIIQINSKKFDYTKFAKKLKEISQDNLFNNLHTLSIQIIFLFDKSTNLKSRLLLGKQWQIYIQKKTKILKIFSRLFSKSEIKLTFMSRTNKFINRNYYDKEIIQQYEENNDFWRLETKSVKNINILIPLVPNSDRTQLDHKLFRFTNSFVFETKNFQKNFFDQKFKEISFSISSINFLRTTLINESEISNIPLTILEGLTAKFEKLKNYREILSFVKSAAYIEQNWNLAFKQDYVNIVNELLSESELTNCPEIENCDLASRAYELNREAIYFSVHCYKSYR